MNASTLVIIRHGETEWNKTYRLMGSSDLPLNRTGKLQAKRVAKYLKDYPFDLIATSPLTRAQQTANAVASYHPGTPVIVVPELREREFGVLEGMEHDTVNALHPQIVFHTVWQYPNHRPEGGESVLDVLTRAKAALTYLTEEFGGKSIAVVSHGAFIRIFLSNLLNVPHENIHGHGFGNASVSVVRYSPGNGGEAHVLNLSGHLEVKSRNPR